MWFQFVAHPLVSIVCCVIGLQAVSAIHRKRKGSGELLSSFVASLDLFAPKLILAKVPLPMQERDPHAWRETPILDTLKLSISKVNIIASTPQNSLVDTHHPCNAEQELQTLLDNAPDAILRLDQQFRYVYVNRKLEQETGLTRSQMLGHTSRELGFADELVEIWHAAAHHVFAHAQEHQLEFESPSSQGLKYYSSRLVPEFAADGSVRTVLAITRNITVQRQAEQRVQQQLQQEQILWKIAQTIRQSLDLDDTLNAAVTEIRTFLDCDRVIIYRFDSSSSGKIVVESIEPGWITMLNEQVLDPCLDLYGLLKRYTDGYAYIVNDIYEAKLTPCHQDLMSRFQIRANLVVPILLQGDRLWGLLAAQQCSEARQWHEWEVTLLQQLATQIGIALKQAELYKQLQELNTDLEQQVQQRTEQIRQALEFEALLKRITDKVRDSLDEHEILQVAVEELAIGLGVMCCDASIYNPEQTISTVIHEYNHPSLPSSMGQQVLMADFHEPKIYATLLQGQDCQFCFMPIRGAHLGLGRSAVLACPVMEDQRVLGDLWLFKPSQQGFSDSEIRLVKQVANQCAIALRQARLYQKVQRQVEELEKLNQLKDDFLSTVSHELRSPMSNIYMASQMLEVFLKPTGALEDASGAARRYFNILQTECRREISLVNDLLDLSRLDAGIDPLVLSCIDLSPWITHVIEPFESRMESQEQQLVLKVPAALPPVTTDLAYLEKAITELIHNASKYTPAGEKIEVAAEAMPTGICLQIRNSGTEIPSEELSKIFDKFHRVPSNDPWKHGGTGLGLALVKKRIHQIQGSISASSAAGWTSFTIQLPWDLDQALTDNCTRHPCCPAHVK